MFAHDHPRVAPGSRVEEDDAAVLQVHQREADGLAGFHGDEHAVLAAGHFALVGTVVAEEAVEDAFAAGVGHELGAVADEAAAGDLEVESDAALLVGHVLHLRLAGAQFLHDHAHVGFGHIHGDVLVGLFPRAVLVGVNDDFGARHAKLEAFPAHVLDEHAEVKLAATADLEGIRRFGVLHAQGHIVLQLLHEAFADAAGLDLLAVLAREGASVDHEHHGDGGLVNVHILQRHRILGGGDGLAHADIGDAGDGHDLASEGLRLRDAGQTLEAVELGDAVLLEGAIALHQRHGLPHLDGAVDDAADADLAHEVVVVHERDEHLEGLGGAAFGMGALLDDGVEERIQVVGRVVRVQHGVALLGGGEDTGEVQLFVRGPQLDEEVEDLILGPVGAGAGAVHLVDDHDGTEAQGQRLAGHELGLGHGAVEGVHHQQHGVHHGKHALHLAAEIGVPRRVHDVETVVVPLERGGLGQDGDAALPLLVVGVHGALLDLLVVPEGVRALEHGVHEGGLAMVHMGDDGDVTDLGDGGHGILGGGELDQKRSGPNP